MYFSGIDKYFVYTIVRRRTIFPDVLIEKYSSTYKQISCMMFLAVDVKFRIEIISMPILSCYFLFFCQFFNFWHYFLVRRYAKIYICHYLYGQWNVSWDSIYLSIVCLYNVIGERLGVPILFSSAVSKSVE